MHRFSLPTLAALVLSLSACGGGGGGSPATPPLPSPPQLAVIIASPSMDGYIVEGLQGRPTLAIASGGLFVGDADALNSGAAPVTAFLSFDLSTIPANATIVSATLRVYQLGNVGDPSALGNVRTLHIDYGPTFEVADLISTVVSQSSHVLATNLTSAWREADVRAEVQTDKGRNSPRVQFLLYADISTTNDDGTDDAYAFEDGDNTNTTGFRPELEIVFTAP